MHICFAAVDYHDGQGGGGIASYVSSLGAELVARGHEVTVLAGGRTACTTYESGMRVVRAPLGNLHYYLHRLHAPPLVVLPLRELEWSVSLRMMLNRLLAERPVDVIECCEMGLLLTTGKLNRLPPQVVRLHGEQYTARKHSGQRIRLVDRVNRRIEFSALRRADRVTAPSHFQAQEFARGLGWASERIRMIPNPVNAGLLQSPGHAQQNAMRRNQHADRPIVLYTGRIQDSKGTIPLLHSVAHVAQAFPDVRYVIAGGRHNSISEDDFKKALNAAGQEHVEWLGHVPWEQLAALYRQASLFVMPSLYESFGISVVEAMAHGLPVVASATGGLSEVVEDGVTGILAPPGDVHALAAATKRLLGDARLRERMGSAGRARVLAMYTPATIADQTLALYKELVG